MHDRGDAGDRQALEQPEPQVGRHAPSQERLPDGRTGMLPSAGLAVAVGNAAFGRMVSRQSEGPVTEAALGGDSAALRDLEARMGRVQQSASARGAQILATADTCVQQLQEVKNHVGGAAKAYRAAHDTFTATLRRADAEYESDKSVEDAVQGILIAAVLAAVLPETLTTGAAMLGLRAMSKTTSTTLGMLGLRGMVAVKEMPVAVKEAVSNAANAPLGEVVEMGVGAVASSTSNDPGRPSDSAAGAGPSTTDKFEELFGHLDRMVDAQPVLGGVGNGQKDLALAASDIARTCAQLRAGDATESTVATLREQAEAIEELERAGARAMADVTAMAGRMLSLKNQALAVRSEPPEVIENQLWTRWMAGLQGGANEMLDNDVLEEYLGPKGKKMFDAGSWMSDSDQADIVSASQRRWLTEQGVEPGNDRLVTNSKFKAQQALLAVRDRVVGKTGRLIDRKQIVIDGARYDYARNAGEFPAGTEMMALHAIIKPHLQGNVIVENWGNDMFDVYCNTVN